MRRYATTRLPTVEARLDCLEVDGRKTNICLGGGHHGQVYVACFFRDELEQDRARRFKSLYFWSSG